MQIDWKDVSEYPDDEPEVLFWMNDGLSPFPVYGRLMRIGGDKERWVWDAIDRGFGTAAKVVAWTYFSPPTKH